MDINSEYVSEYVEGFYAGENMYEFCEDKSDEWKRGYQDGIAQAFEDCPEFFN